MSVGLLTRYYQQHGYKATYEIGDRIRGFYNGIPFIGSVGNDSLVNEDEGPRVSVHLDLPMMIDGKLRTVIIVKHKDIGPAEKFSFMKKVKAK